MTRLSRAFLLSGALLLSGACAATKTAGVPGTAAAPSRDIAALDAALAAESDAAKIPALLFQRGHAYLEAAEIIRDRRGQVGPDGRPTMEFEKLMLSALNDFEAVATRYPSSADAPEALFHLGVAYDYPNLTTFSVAMGYYQRTIEVYPGTESASKAQAALEKIWSKVREMESGHHGKQ